MGSSHHLSYTGRNDIGMISITRLLDHMKFGEDLAYDKTLVKAVKGLR